VSDGTNTTRNSPVVANRLGWLDALGRGIGPDAAGQPVVRAVGPYAKLAALGFGPWCKLHHAASEQHQSRHAAVAFNQKHRSVGKRHVQVFGLDGEISCRQLC